MEVGLLHHGGSSVYFLGLKRMVLFQVSHRIPETDSSVKGHTHEETNAAPEVSVFIVNRLLLFNSNPLLSWASNIGYLENDLLHTRTSVTVAEGGRTSRLHFYGIFQTPCCEKPVQHSGDTVWRCKWSMLCKAFLSAPISDMNLFFRWLEYRWRSWGSALTTKLHSVSMWWTWWQLVPQVSLAFDSSKI